MVTIETFFQGLTEANEARTTSDMKFYISAIILSGQSLTDEQRKILAKSVENLAKFVEMETKQDIADRIMNSIY